MTVTLPALVELLRTTWADRAACATAEPTRFDPTGVRRGDVHRAAVATANRYCATCPVLRDCAAEADRDGLQGIWGGSQRVREARGARFDLTVTPLIPNAPARSTTAPRSRRAVS